MLIKLLKYELKATARQFIPLYGALLILAVLNLLFASGDPFMPSFPSTISLAVYFALLVAMFVLTLVVMIQRFNKNLLSDEGYLMFTLPVNTSDLVISKLIASLIWLAASMAVLFVSLFIISSGTGSITSIPDAWNELAGWFASYVDGSAWLLAVETAISTILDVCCSILIIYASISIGHLFGGRRIIASFGAFLLLSIVYSAFVSGVLGGLGLLNLENSLSSSAGLRSSPLLIHGTAIIDIALAAIFSLICYVITTHVLSKHLNLE